jgi:ribosome-binding factor A
MSQRRSSHGGSNRSYPRTARINEALREVIAEELEIIGDERLDLLTVTGITTDPDLRHATVWYSTLAGRGDLVEVREALAEHRVQLQGAVGRQVRLKRTPLLQFSPDPAIEQGQRIEDILRTMPRSSPELVDPDDLGTDVLGTDVLGTDVLGTDVLGTDVMDTDDIDVAPGQI